VERVNGGRAFDVAFGLIGRVVGRDIGAGVLEDWAALKSGRPSWALIDVLLIASFLTS